eukprot:TRINITY_DN12026_c1_g1_i1.p1 TRINITY_DN12026_c1_g1~~TRINITY_DN12026_c1_g1_i1.p1  ORF type:complete len:358 (+),score=99.66 TRINITY_DN12026_c1_g1_i1:47-1120(+)
MKAVSFALMMSLGAAEGYSFSDYTKEYGKVYEAEEFARREEIFHKNLEYITAHNAEEGRTWTAGLNEYTDWSNEEFRAKRTGLNKKWWFNNHEARLNGVDTKVKDLPASVDWRKHSPSVVSPVKNQGGCGSCWAFSATETIESAVAIATGKLPILSPQQLVSCVSNPRQCGGTGGCDGATQPLAFNYTMHNGGMTTEADYPYRGVTGTCEKDKIKPVVGIKGQVDLKTNDEQALATAVATVGPIAISLDAGSLGWQTYRSGVLTKDCGSDIDHAVQLVGYGTDNGVDYWIVRNSWGASWGEEGYIRIIRHADGQAPCATDKNPSDGFGCKGGPATIQVCGLCGILSGSSYPTGAFNI